MSEESHASSCPEGLPDEQQSQIRREEGLQPDDSGSYSEEQRIAASLRTGSWDSQHSFDNNERPSSGASSSRRDRRKQFDTTTPTLVDEDEAEQEMLSFEQRGHSASFDDVRRTPGASMYKSAYPSSQGGSSSTEEPSKFTFQRSFDKRREDDSKARAHPIWPTSAKATSLSSETCSNRGQGTEPHQPEAAGVSAATSDQASSGGHGPFFSPWTRGAALNQVGSATTEGRTGAFSPTTLRLREELGILLQEDEEEDDQRPFGVPMIRRSLEGVGDFTSVPPDFGIDWTGSYVFDSSAPHRQKPGVPRDYYHQREGKPRRRFGGNQPGNFLVNAQQPKPRRSGSGGFEFGKTSTPTATGDERASPQLLNFGGAFGPPADSGSFMRPVAVGGIPTTEGQSVSGQQGGTTFDPTVQHGGFRFGAEGTAPPQPIAFQQGELPQSIFGAEQGTYQQAPNSAPIPNPMSFVPAAEPQFEQQPQSSSQASEMQATAREFVPMLTRSTTPQFQSHPSQHWQPVQLPPPPDLPSQAQQAGIDQGSWHGNTNLRFVPSYAFPAFITDPRIAMTPSPHLPWQHPVDPSSIGTQVAPDTPQMAFNRAAMTPTPTHSQASATSVDPSTQPRKKELKRGKRGKKKSQKEKEKEKTEAPSVAKKTPTRKKKGEPARPGSAVAFVQDISAAEEGNISASEDPVDAKRAELVESPAVRTAFKEFYRSLRNEERVSFQKAEIFALQSIEDGSVPEAVHWRVYLELADLAKRANRFGETRRLYRQVCSLQPYAFQGWLEYSKLEEESGHLNRAVNILHAGLEYCEHNETLMTRAVKLQEKMGDLDMARALLARLKNVGIHKVWKTILEGALIEARAGNIPTARRVLKYLMHHVPWYGPLYLEAYRLERDQRRITEALQVVERGLRAIPRYGPLWFGAMRLCEEIDCANGDYHLPTTTDMIQRATGSISKELVWKIHLEAAQMHERAALLQASVDDPSFDTLLDPARQRLALTVFTCPNNLRWKVWLAAARTELGFGNTGQARELFQRAHKVVPEKGRSATLLECARLEEFLGDAELARAVLSKARRDFGFDWKVWLESVLLEIRDQQFQRAVEICQKALETHIGTGRLWACLVQLQQFKGGDKAQCTALKLALNAVPKSGEVWCEGGRIHLNPYSASFDIARARRHLYFATKFTPQYGDSFVEGIRLEFVHQWLSPIADYIWEKTGSTLQGEKAEGEDRAALLSRYVSDVALAVFTAASKHRSSDQQPFGHIIDTVRAKLKPGLVTLATELNDLRLACANADPNYGSFWFFCRQSGSDPPRKVMDHAADHVAKDLQSHAHVYLVAMIRRQAILYLADMLLPPSGEATIESSDSDVADWEDRTDMELMSFASLDEMLKTRDSTLFESALNGSIFVAGLSELNKHKPLASMTLMERKTALFGNDALFP